MRKLQTVFLSIAIVAMIYCAFALIQNITCGEDDDNDSFVRNVEITDDDLSLTTLSDYKVSNINNGEKEIVSGSKHITSQDEYASLGLSDSDEVDASFTIETVDLFETNNLDVSLSSEEEISSFNFELSSTVNCGYIEDTIITINDESFSYEQLVSELDSEECGLFGLVACFASAIAATISAPVIAIVVVAIVVVVVAVKVANYYNVINAPSDKITYSNNDANIFGKIVSLENLTTYKYKEKSYGKYYFVLMINNVASKTFKISKENISIGTAISVLKADKSEFNVYSKQSGDAYNLVYKASGKTPWGYECHYKGYGQYFKHYHIAVEKNNGKMSHGHSHAFFGEFTYCAYKHQWVE